MKRLHLSPTVRFALPVIIENVLTIVAGQLSSALIGQISANSLAAVGTVNTVINFSSAAFALINTGSTVLVARLVGARDQREASHMIEQSIFFLALGSVALTGLFAVLAAPIMRLLMPTAEDGLFGEAVLYFRILALSFPFLMLQTLLGGVLRASGNSRATMLVGLSANFLQVVAAWLMIDVFSAGLYGAGASYVFGRAVGAAAAFVIALRAQTHFRIRVKNIFRPRLDALKRIFRIGFPTSIEQTFVQGGYLIANSLVVGLGTMSATVYQVCNTVNNYTSLPWGICSATALSMVGLRLGEKKPDEAKKIAWHVWLAGAASTVSIGLVMALCGRSMAGIYSSDPLVVDESLKILWLLVPMSVPALSINVMDSTLRAGGDAKFVMYGSLVGVWLIRIPMTWLLAYRLGMGIIGVYLANFASFIYRGGLGLIRYARGKWIHKSL